jgi:hypothetical protein
MKMRWLLGSVVVLGILAGCNDAGTPTEPGAALNVNGAWTGSMTSYSPTCAREGIAVTLSQDGTTVTGNFPTSCQGRLTLRGAMSGDSIVGELIGTTDGVRIGQFSGTASRASIRITTWGPQSREDRGPPQQAVINVIDLAR